MADPRELDRVKTIRGFQRRNESLTAENTRLRAALAGTTDALKKARDWLDGWASAEREIAIIDAALARASLKDQRHG